MEERTIIEGRLERGASAINFIGAGLWGVIALVLLIIETQVAGGILFLLSLPFLGMTAAEIILGIRFLKSGITVTNQSVCIRGRSRVRNISINEITAANPFGKTGIAISTVRGGINVKNILNNKDVCAEINKLVQNRQGVQANVPPQQTDSADQLKKFKDLLDSGVITQEEFDAKKKELLGL